MIALEVSNCIAIGYICYSLINLLNSFFKGNFKINLLCKKCITFWVVFVLTKGDLTSAALCSLTVYLLENAIATKL